MRVAKRTRSSVKVLLGQPDRVRCQVPRDRADQRPEPAAETQAADDQKPERNDEAAA